MAMSRRGRQALERLLRELEFVLYQEDEEEDDRLRECQDDLRRCQRELQNRRTEGRRRGRTV